MTDTTFSMGAILYNTVIQFQVMIFAGLQYILECFFCNYIHAARYKCGFKKVFLCHVISITYML